MFLSSSHLEHPRSKSQGEKSREHCVNCIQKEGEETVEEKP